MTTRIALWTFALAIGGCAAAGQPAPNAAPPPDLADISYSSHKACVLDLWKAKSEKPAPLMIFIHGGGFRGGDKKQITTQLALAKFLQAGVSCASINYRLTNEAIYPAPMHDGARAVQFLRSKASEWNLDPKRFACSGGSAGAGISLWLAFHDNLADPKSEDPVARESTRISCAAVFQGQCSYDPRFIKEHIPGNGYQETALPPLFGMKPGEMLTPTPEKAKLMEDGAPINHVNAGDPPVHLRYSGSPDDPKGDIHHAKFGVVLKAKMDELKIECVLVTGGNRAPGGEVDFVLKHLGVK